MEAWRIADLHAYVDECLEPDERLAFEHEMAEDPALARHAAAWRAQNSAIRSAFDGEGAKAFSISLVRPQNEPFGKVRRAGGGRRKSAFRASDASFIAHDRGRLAIFVEGRCASRISSVGLMASGARGAGRRPRLPLGSGGAHHSRERTGRGERCGFPGVQSFGRSAGRIRDRRQDRSASVADAAPHASRLPAGNSFRHQALRRANRSISWRPGGLSRLQNPRAACRIIGPVPGCASNTGAWARHGGWPPRDGMDVARSGICLGRRRRRRLAAQDRAGFLRAVGRGRSGRA